MSKGGWRLVLLVVLLPGGVLLLRLAGQAPGAGAAPLADPAFTLDLGGLRFDPLAGVPAYPAGLAAVRADVPDLHLIQLVGPTEQAWLDALAGQGLAIVQYVHPYTYVVWGRAPEAAARDAGFVRWTGPFAPAYRLLPQHRTLDASPRRVDVLLYRGADVAGAVDQIADLGALLIGRRVLNGTWETAGFEVAGAALPALARVPGVYSVQPQAGDGGVRTEMANQINVNNHDGGNVAFPGYQAWLSAAGVDGSGVIIANVDGGIDQTHPDLINNMLPCSGGTCGGGLTSNHGTHTAGIMAGDGASETTDAGGFLRGQGMAPGANLVEQVYSPFFTQPGGMLRLMTDSYANAAALSGNSWGPSGSPQGYDDDTLQVDIGVRDADPNLAGNQPLSYVLSFMNGGGGTSTQGTPDEAKNIFTIGSTKMQSSSGAQILAINDLSANSAHGPALDGRTIPHLVAPGCSVDSTVSGGGYGLLCGTSMASPHVSGAVALFIEYYRNLIAADPSPALVKAAFLPVAHDLAGFRDADGGILGHPFDSKQGWGRLDAEAVITPAQPVFYFDQGTILDNTGETWSISLSVADVSAPVRIMLVWTDAPGHGLGGSTPAWNNDLDLEVEYDGLTYPGNSFDSSGWSMSGGAADGMNNTEGVFLGPTASGRLTVRVTAANINSDGVPNSGDSTDQDFALVCYNCLEGTVPDQLLVTKDASATTVAAGSVFTYTLAREMSLSGVHTYTEQLVDQIPAGLTLLTDTLTLDGVPRPDLYDVSSHAISTTLSGVFTDTHHVAIVFQVHVEPDAPGGQIINAWQTMLSIDGDTATGPYGDEVTVNLLRWFLPAVRRD